MHEMSIALELMRQLESLAAENRLERIKAITVAAGAMRQVAPDALAVAFEAVSAGTCADGAELTLEVVSVAARCRQCAARFEPEAGSFQCPQCRQADVDIVEGDDIILASVTGETQEEGPPDED